MPILRIPPVSQDRSAVTAGHGLPSESGCPRTTADDSLPACADPLANRLRAAPGSLDRLFSRPLLRPGRPRGRCAARGESLRPALDPPGRLRRSVRQTEPVLRPLQRDLPADAARRPDGPSLHALRRRQARLSPLAHQRRSDDPRQSQLAEPAPRGRRADRGGGDRARREVSHEPGLPQLDQLVGSTADALSLGPRRQHGAIPVRCPVLWRQRHGVSQQGTTQSEWPGDRMANRDRPPGPAVSRHRR